MHKQRKMRLAHAAPYYHHSHTTGEGVTVGIVMAVVLIEVSVGVVRTVGTAGKAREGQGTVGATTPDESQALG
jgi:hypothetical protein